ncbi:PhzF family phenazine biosynthesis protein [Chloroflexota bacterium]
MKIPIYQVDAFTSELFSGNPAAVCILDEWLDDERLQAIAAENNLSETAFLLQRNGEFEIRWFTPVTEVSLCGHATLASAFVVFNYMEWSEDIIHFQSLKSGTLTVTRNKELLEMDFPAKPPSKQAAPERLSDIFNHSPLEVLGVGEYLLVVFEDEHIVRELKPDFPLLMQIEQRATIVSAPGDECDFVSRFFAPRVGIPEDPVTGSAHCILIPYWASRLSKRKLHAIQVSKRGGELFCEDRGDRVTIAGKAALYLEGKISI